MTETDHLPDDYNEEIVIRPAVEYGQGVEMTGLRVRNTLHVDGSGGAWLEEFDMDGEIVDRGAPEAIRINKAELRDLGNALLRLAEKSDERGEEWHGDRDG